MIALCATFCAEDCSDMVLFGGAKKGFLCHFLAAAAREIIVIDSKTLRGSFDRPVANPLRTCSAPGHRYSPGAVPSWQSI
ncbi:MAG: hypothetical protein JO122_21490 [Acetobacteraceae bacterium]|nr:hypothetical protein [Acetobacteraceae bacterium]